MQNTTSCPSCQRELRVPDEFIGTQVKCGACDAVFTATGSAGASGKDSSGQARGGGYLRGDEHVKENVRPRPRPKGKRNSRQAAREAVLAPAICIMALGGIEIVFYIIYGIAFSGLMSSEAQDPQMPQMPRGFRPIQPGPNPQVPQIPRQFGPYQAGQLAGFIASICWGCFIIFGGISMKMLTSFRTAIVVSIAVMIPCTPGCVLGLPLGIWALIVLNRPDVKSAFE